MNANSIQTLLFQHVKGLLPSHLSLVDEIAGLLQISNDSAYRRIRGEKAIDLEEIQKLCSHFKISVDQLLHLQSNAFIFTGDLCSDSDNRFKEYLDTVHKQFQWVNSFEKKQIYFLLKDIPPFVHFQIPELATFKFFFWMKSILHYEGLKGVKYSHNDSRYQDFLITSKSITALYNRLPTTEIWNIETINSTLRQIEFYREAGSFSSVEDVRLLYTKLEVLVNHIERQAEAGVKYEIGQQPTSNSPEYRFFVNELITGDNTFMAELDNVRITFLNHSVLYFVGTRDVKFNTAMFNNLENIMKKSTLISTVGEKERNKFFNRIRHKIHSRLTYLK